MNQSHAWLPPSRLDECFLHMKSKGGIEAVVNPLALLCLTDSFVFIPFPGSRGLNQVLPQNREEQRGDEKPESGAHTDPN